MRAITGVWEIIANYDEPRIQSVIEEALEIDYVGIIFVMARLPKDMLAFL